VAFLASGLQIRFIELAQRRITQRHDVVNRIRVIAFAVRANGTERVPGDVRLSELCPMMVIPARVSAWAGVFAVRLAGTPDDKRVATGIPANG